MSDTLASLGWDFEVDTPASIAVLGGGMLAVESALYARFLGYSVLLLDDAKVGDELLVWGDSPMLNAAGSPATWREVTTPLGLAALEAQHGSVTLPELDQIATHRGYVESYLLPVARTDLLYDAVQIHSKVLSISRHGCDAWNSCSLEERSEMLFRILIDGHNRGEYTQLFDVVLDCTTRPARRLGLASGGGLAIGEQQFEPAMLRGRIDVLKKHRPQVAGKHVVLFGNNLEAYANALDLLQLAELQPTTRCTWIIPKRLGVKGYSFPSPTDIDSPVVADIVTRAQQLAVAEDPRVVALGAWGIESLAHESNAEQGEEWSFRLQTKSEETLDIHGDIFINCAHARSTNPSAEQLMTAPLDGEDLSNTWPLTSEPHYYRLGRRGAKWWNGALVPSSVDQVRAAFALIGGRRELNLYETVRPST